MKTYRVSTDHYRQLLRACRDELRVLGYGPATCRLGGVAEFLGRMERAGKTALDGITKHDIEAHVSHLYTRASRQGGTLSGYTVLGYVFNLRLLFDYAERHGLIGGGSPLAGLSFSRPVTPPRYYCSAAEIAALYRNCRDDGRMTAILHLLYGCGLRRMEAAVLNVGDVDYGAGLLYVRRGKGRRRRVVPLSAGVSAGLRNYQRGERWHGVEVGRDNGDGGTTAFLLDDRGTRMRGDTLRRHLARLVRRAEVSQRITPHVLRHSIATHLLAGGMPVERVRDFLGHELLETTQLYTHVDPEAPDPATQNPPTR